jgi:hypothetical protein
MPVMMDDDMIEALGGTEAVASMWVPAGDLIRPGWYVEGGDFARPEDRYPPNKCYQRFGPFASFADALCVRNDQEHGRWRVVHTSSPEKRIGGKVYAMLPWAEPGEFERV